MKKVSIIIIVMLLISSQLTSFDGMNIKTLKLSYLKKFTQIILFGLSGYSFQFKPSEIKTFSNNGKTLKIIMVYGDTQNTHTLFLNLEIIKYGGYAVYDNELKLFFR